MTPKEAVAILMQREWNRGENGTPVTVLRLEIERLEGELQNRDRGDWGRWRAIENAVVDLNIALDAMRERVTDGHDAD